MSNQCPTTTMRERLVNTIFHPTNRQRQTRVGLMFVLPCALVVISMLIIPVVQTFVFSVSEVSLPGFETKFIGLDNFEDVLTMKEFPTVVKNTIVWVIGTVILRVLLGFTAAFIMDGQGKSIRFARVLALLPWTIPSIVAANSWRWMLQSDFGLINSILESVGLGVLAQPWLSTASTAMPTVMVAYMWTGFPFVMMIILAGLQSIPDSIYEASSIDGANKFQQFIYVTMPCLKSVIVMVVVLEIISAINAFDLLFVLTGGGPGTSSEILGILIHRLGFKLFDFARASAASTLLIGVALLCFCLYAPTQAIRKRETK